jgi:uncharacterized HAD superfamily protein
MNIGIDFDDVITEFTDSLMEFYHRKYGKKVVREEIKEWDWGLYWGISREEATKRVDEFHETHSVENVNPLENALSSLKKLMKANEIFIITGRPVRFKSKVESWLHYHLKDKLPIIHAGEWHKGQAASKAEICKELKIPILLEDAPNAAIECAKAGVRVILFDYPWNQKLKHKNVKRVKNWLEAVEEIEHFKSIK